MKKQSYYIVIKGDDGLLKIKLIDGCIIHDYKTGLNYGLEKQNNKNYVITELSTGLAINTVWQTRLNTIENCLIYIDTRKDDILKELDKHGEIYRKQFNDLIK